MQTIIVNLKSLYPEHYKEDMLIEIATEIFEIIDSYEHMESAYDRKLRYHKVYYSLERVVRMLKYIERILIEKIQHI